jgi:hypothetical protein
VTFVQRQINLQFSDSSGQAAVDLQGVRCQAIIDCRGGNFTSAQLELRVYGLPMAVMNRFSGPGIAAITWAQNLSYVTLSAGSVGGAISQLFSGSLIGAYIDFAGTPDVCFVCSAVAGVDKMALPSAPNSKAGAQNAEDLIAALASSMGYTFQNPNGAHAVLQNQYTSGSVLSQIQTIAQAASIAMEVANTTITIWPNGGNRDSVVIDISPGQGLVGYPTYWQSGFVIKTEFNPMMANGRSVNLTGSVITKANGLWPIYAVSHELATLMPDGPWFSTVKLSPSAYVSAN